MDNKKFHLVNITSGKCHSDGNNLYSYPYNSSANKGRDTGDGGRDIHLSILLVNQELVLYTTPSVNFRGSPVRPFFMPLRSS